MRKDVILKSDYDGLGISVMSTVPEEGASAVLQLVHGMRGHKERYQPIMEYLASCGIACVAADIRGHGASIRDKGDLGYMYGGGVDAVIDDMRLINAWCHEKFTDLPVFLLGHSMGALASKVYVKRYDSTVSGLILCGFPAISAPLSLFAALLKTMNMIGGRFRPYLMSALLERRLNRRFSSEGTMSWTCSDEQVRKRFADDPLSDFTFTVDADLCLLEMMLEACSFEGWTISNPRLPVYFISGEEDPCMSDEAYFHKSAGQMVQVGYSDVSSAIYEGMRHEVLNEVNRRYVWEDVLCHIRSWLEKQ